MYRDVPCSGQVQRVGSLSSDHNPILRLWACAVTLILRCLDDKPDVPRGGCAEVQLRMYGQTAECAACGCLGYPAEGTGHGGMGPGSSSFRFSKSLFRQDCGADVQGLLCWHASDNDPSTQYVSSPHLITYYADGNAVPQAKRTFVVAMADAYRLGRELIDQEPNRSVQIRRRVDTRIPNPLLSTVAPPPVGKPSLGNLGNLRAPKQAPPWAAKPTAGTLSAGNQTGTAAAVVASRAPSRPATPVAPLLDPSVPMGDVHSGRSTPTPVVPVSAESASAGAVRGEIKHGKVGQVDADDWDMEDT